jgi:FkbM family methyltransferase
MTLLLSIYRFLFARPALAPLNKLVLLCGMNGLGILNYSSTVSSGESRFLRRLANSLWSASDGKDPPIIFDVGAHSGDFSQLVCDLDPRATVYAFEPHPATFARLLERSLPNVECVNSAVGCRTGVASLYDTQSSGGSEHASTVMGVVDGVYYHSVESKQVPIVTIDAFLEQREISRISLLKIDVEGAELEVLKGAEKAIKAGKIDVIQFEFNEMNVVSRVFFRDFWEFLEGYAFYRVLPYGLLPISNYRSFFCELFAYQNIIALRPQIRLCEVIEVGFHKTNL